ncbi:flagellar motor switch phosphatase FliY [Sedimentibacter sp. zth1]|uniref:flagellar motor switch phosphatase FliY n=1 Tax=Sedimentibacter sp. zth1 TaxID=2816908 RepID=UPI001A925FAC|nr:flagellar motor switch phosphatase FliY [Sedimentibacter sp. zth1]QSX07190.1 flagellar motor switch phosphatase FliY [Sedimentibacter sp. zth1]
MENSNEMYLSEMEKDVIGEVMNISLGSSATSLSSLLNQRVDITVPEVNVVSAQKFDFEDLEPAIGVEIKYISGIEGDNVMILKKDDIKVILETLMGTEIADDEFELDEIAMSAVCEVMNQMMGSSATALADFIGKRVDISTPVTYEIVNKEDFKGRYYADNDIIVSVKFKLKVGDIINSEFINVISVPLAKEMVTLFLSGTGLGDNTDTTVETTESMPSKSDDTVKTENGEKKQKEINKKEQVMPHSVQYENEDTEEEEVNRPKSRRKKQHEYYEDDFDEEDEDYDYEPRRRKSDRRTRKSKTPVNVSPMEYESFEDEEEELSNEQLTNLGLIMSVPLQISVEIGRTKKKIKEILEFQQGSIVELNKQAGAQVDVIVNGQVIAKGDVVVVNDNFGVRVTEIVKKDDIVKITM